MNNKMKKLIFKVATTTIVSVFVVALAAGAATTVGDAITTTGLITGSLGATVTGATVNLNASSNFDVNVATGTSTGDITLGGGTAGQLVSINSSDWDIDATGAMTGIGSITSDGTITATTFIGALTGNVTGNVSGTSGSTTGNAATVTDGVYTTDTGTVTSLMLQAAAADLGAADVEVVLSNTNAGGFNTNITTDGTITATTFIGALTGNVTGNVSGTSGSTTGNAATVTDGVYTTDTGTVTSLMLQAAAADLGAADVEVVLSNTNAGGFNTNITTDGTITATTFIGALTGNVTGNVSGTSGSTTGNAATVTDGVYTTDTGTVTSLMLQAAAADLGAADVEVVLSNTNAGGFNTNITTDGTITATTFIGALTGNVTGNVSGTSGSTTGNAATVTDGVYTTDTGTVTSLMLQAAAADLGAADVEVVLSNTNAGGFNTNITTDGTITATTFIGALTGNVTGNVSGTSGSTTGNAATVTDGVYTTDTGTVTSLMLQAAAADLGAADVEVVLSNTNAGGFNTNITTDGTITATTFIGALTGNVTGNVSGTSGSTTGNAATVTDGVYTTDTGTVTSLMLQAAAADLGAADVEDVLSNTNAGGFNTNITTDGTITATTFIGALTGNVTGNVSGTSGSTTGNAATVTDGVYTTDTGTVTSLMLQAAAADLGAADVEVVLSNTNAGGFNTNITTDGTITATTFIGALTGNVTGNVSGTSGSTTGNAATVTDGVYTTDTGTVTSLMLQAAAADLGAADVEVVLSNTNAGGFNTNITTDGTITATTFIGALTGNVTGNVSGTSGSTTGNAATVTDGVYTTDTGTVTSLMLQAAAADLGAADVEVVLSNTNAGGFNTNITTDGTITATTFIGALTGNVTGNVSGTSGSTTGNAATVTDGDYTTDTGTVTSLMLQAAAADLGAADVEVVLSNTNAGGFNTNITTDGAFTSGILRIPREEAAGPTNATAPAATCDAANLGAIVMVDENDAANAWLWGCEETVADTTYAWINLSIQP